MRCFGLITFLLLLSFPAYSQIYRVQDSPAPQEEAFKNSAWEVSAGAFVSSTSLRTAAGKTVSHGEVGISARALYALNNWVSLGVEGGLPRASDTEAVLEKYQVWRVGAVGKFSVTKGTSPRAYILAGVGLSAGGPKCCIFYPPKPQMFILRQAGVWNGLRKGDGSPGWKCMALTTRPRILALISMCPTAGRLAPNCRWGLNSSVTYNTFRPGFLNALRLPGFFFGFVFTP